MNTKAIIQKQEELNTSSFNTTSARCLNGHTWTYSASYGYNLEGTPCDCGEVIYHSEICKECGSKILKPIPNGNK